MFKFMNIWSAPLWLKDVIDMDTVGQYSMLADS